MPVDLVATSDVADVLRPIWKTKHITATRLRGRIEAVLAWATVQGMRDGANPARWRDNLAEVFKPAKGKKARAEAKVVPHAALAYSELPALMAKLRLSEGVMARALELLVLSACRVGEVLGADWSEIDLVGKLWTIPGARMKAGIEHTVPLSDRAVAILRRQGPKASGLVFPGPRGGGKMKNDSLRAILHELLGTSETATLHGMRSSFRDWASERATGIPAEAAEQALAHAIGDKVSRAYDRSKRLELRARLMQMWSVFCESPPVIADGKVTPLRRQA
jgi:integrase